MDSEPPQDRLSHIITQWSVVDRAHGEQADEVALAQLKLINRYSGAIRRYLLGALRDTHTAADLFQDFQVKLLRGDFRRASRDKGRFRDFLKTALFHLIVDYQRRQKHEPMPLSTSFEVPVGDAAPPVDEDKAFLSSWREELLDRAWAALADLQQRTGQPYYAVLRAKAEATTVRSEELAGQMTRETGKAWTAENVRQVLHRAREKFGELLLEEVERSLDQPDVENLEQELIDLNMLKYCKSAIEKRSAKGRSSH